MARQLRGLAAMGFFLALFIGGGTQYARTRVATKYSQRAQNLERELTETATKYSLWGQKLERELNRIDPNGAPGRRFDAQDES
jgi:hypothetical protein